MSRVSKIIITLAVLAAIMPYLGFPAVFKNGFVLIACLAIASLVYLKEKHMLHTRQKQATTTVQADTFSENTAPEPASHEEQEPTQQEDTDHTSQKEAQ